ncbi:MAG: 3-isopropylmalate dehydratase small subunit [Candidatus Omnitrophota bacterium]|nr:3-isopropylmalate dehydratase small subunit [Candidatus Omnitrophota bacterium]
MILKGTVYKLPDNINTDLIISGRYKFSITDMRELAKHVFEDYDPNLAGKLKPGESIIVAGENFGMGSSREQAPLAMKHAGIVAVVAKSFARIFYRNAFNIGLPLIEIDTKDFKDGNNLEIDLVAGLITDLNGGKQYQVKSLPSFMQTLLKDGGLVAHFKKHGKLDL